MVSYRVGHMIRNLTCFLPDLNIFLSLNFYNSGNEYAIVLPEPVLSLARISLPLYMASYVNF